MIVTANELRSRAPERPCALESKALANAKVLGRERGPLARHLAGCEN